MFQFFRNSNQRKSIGFLEARKQYERKIEFKETIADIGFMCCGVISAGFGLKGFLIPNHFLDGGATGLSLLLNHFTGINLPLLLLLVNLPFVLIAYKLVGRNFAIKTAIAIVLLSLCTAYIPYPQITNDKLLVSVFGGFFLGAGIGLAMRGGLVIDGTEVLAIAVSKKSGLSIGDVIMGINIFVFSLSAWMISIETALYAMLTYMAASKTVDFLIEGIEEYIGVTIISIKEEKIREAITYKLGRGITVYKGERGFGRSGEMVYDIKILYTIITRLEISQLKLEIEKIDPNAFVFMTSVKDMKGGMIKHRRH
jgi:uncharacterized membrane-anchored protein YitT (DUF2179 family)